MADKVLIYGKNTWPYTNSAREAFKKSGVELEYFDVVSNRDKLEEMLEYSKGTRKVPVIVEAGRVTIGYDGGS